METIYDVPVILRREIEALMVKPFLDAFEKELGRDKTYAVAASVIEEIAEKQGAEYAQMLGGNDMKHLIRQGEGWSSNNALDEEQKVIDDYSGTTTIHHCAYVQMYERIGMRDLGGMLSCLRDEAFYKGFNPKLVMTRTKTLMCGGDCCDFGFQFPREG